MRTVLAVLVVAAITAVGGATDAAAAKRHKCPARQGHTLARTAHARVWYVGDPQAGADYYGCLKSKGRVRKLASTSDCFHTCDEIAAPFRLKGRFVAWNHESSFSYGGGAPSTFEQDVEVFDLRSGRRVLTTQVYYTETGGADPARTSGAPLAGLLVDPHGTVAILSGAAPNFTLGRMRIGETGPTEIDSGAIDPQSLRLDGELLSWTNAGQAKSASLR
jgi:hypothetical protein